MNFEGIKKLVCDRVLNEVRKLGDEAQVFYPVEVETVGSYHLIFVPAQYRVSDGERRTICKIRLYAEINEDAGTVDYFVRSGLDSVKSGVVTTETKKLHGKGSRSAPMRDVLRADKVRV